jgi:uncharacterized protein (TIGR02118 family)
MIRSIAFIQRRPDLSRGEFRRYYEENHAPFARPQLAGLRHYVRNHVLAEQAVAAVEFDAISEFEYVDRAALDALLAFLDGPAGDAIREDESQFMHKAGNSFFGSQRRALGGGTRPAPGQLPKAIALLRTHEGGERRQLAERAADTAAALLAQGTARHAELDTALPGDPLGRPAWDVLLHLWYDAAAQPGDALDDLAHRLEGATRLRCLWIDECGEPCGIEAERPVR